MDLFTSRTGTETPGNSPEPLAYRMRPRSLGEFIGQDHIIGKGRLLRRVIQADRISSVLFYGPPGTGKTTLAQVIAHTTKSSFAAMNAVLSGVKELRETIEQAKERYSLYGRRTILFVDEVHRWNKAQQDALLPWVESGTVILIGATTENPFFEVNSALVSRSRIFQLKSLTEKDLETVVRSAILDPDRGYGKYAVTFQEEALEHLIKTAAGDARSLLNALELAVETTPHEFPPPEGTSIHITMEIAEESIQQKVVLYDKEGDYHYDVISAFIKSIRGSDPDAALYWLAKMIRAGEDPGFIFRRMLISACEDIGLADPQALVITQAAAAAFDRVGLPEGNFHLTHAALYLSTAPKSNSALAFFDAMKALEEEPAGDVPNHLRDASRDKVGFGHGAGYLYPHAFREHWTAQQYLPDILQGRIFYRPGETGYEGRIRGEVERKRELLLEAGPSRAPREILTFTGSRKKEEQWINRLNEESGSGALKQVREKLFTLLDPARHHKILIPKAGRGFLVWEALRKTPEGGVWALSTDDEDADFIDGYARQLDIDGRPEIRRGTLDTFHQEFGPEGENFGFDGVIWRNMLLREPDRLRSLSLLRGLLSRSGRMVFTEPLPRMAQRLLPLFEEALTDPERDLLKEAEDAVYSDTGNPLLRFDEVLVGNLLGEAGFEIVHSEIWDPEEERRIPRELIRRWFDPEISPHNYGAMLRQRYLSMEEKILRFAEHRSFPWSTPLLFVQAAVKDI